MKQTNARKSSPRTYTEQLRALCATIERIKSSNMPPALKHAQLVKRIHAANALGVLVDVLRSMGAEREALRQIGVRGAETRRVWVGVRANALRYYLAVGINWMIAI